MSAQHSDKYTDKYTVGVDFGTLTARAVVVRVSDGAEVGTGVHPYRHGVIDQRLPISGEELPPDWALQDPDDYLESLGVAVRLAVASSAVDPAAIVAIATDFTACTMVPTLVDGTPVCHLPEFKDRPHAFVKLWRHHAAQPQADRINKIAAARNEPWLSRYGGLISSEWEFAKGLELLENDAEVYRAMDRWVEAADWIVWQLCGRYVRNTCTAGYKGTPPGRQLPVSRVPRRAQPSVRRLRHGEARPAGRRPGRGCRNPHGGRRGAVPACTRGSSSPSGTSTRTSPRRRPGPWSLADWSRSWAPRPATS